MPHLYSPRDDRQKDGSAIIESSYYGDKTMHHQFTVIVDTEIDSEQQIMDIADALGNSGCLDSSVGGHPEGVELIFNREADSLDSALKSAISDIESAGYRVKRVEMAREALS